MHFHWVAVMGVLCKLQKVVKRLVVEGDECGG